MISNIAGILLKKNTKTKIWWMKLGIALIVSNVFFFVLFAGTPEESQPEAGIPVGSVEMQIKAELLTPFAKGKKVLLIQRSAGWKAETLLRSEANLEGRITVLISEADAPLLLRFENWEILPYLKHFNLYRETKGSQHEIRY